MDMLSSHLMLWGTFFVIGLLFGFGMGWALILSGKMRF